MTWEILGALACAMFAGWQIGDMLRPALRRLGALPALPMCEGQQSIILPESEGYQARRLPVPELLLLTQDDLRRISQ